MARSSATAEIARPRIVCLSIVMTYVENSDRKAEKSSLSTYTMCFYDAIFPLQEIPAASTQTFKY